MSTTADVNGRDYFITDACLGMIRDVWFPLQRKDACTEVLKKTDPCMQLGQGGSGDSIQDPTAKYLVEYARCGGLIAEFAREKCAKRLAESLRHR